MDVLPTLLSRTDYPQEIRKLQLLDLRHSGTSWHLSRNSNKSADDFHPIAGRPTCAARLPQDCRQRRLQPARFMMGNGLLQSDIERQALGNGSGHRNQGETGCQPWIVAISPGTIGPKYQAGRAGALKRVNAQ